MRLIVFLLGMLSLMACRAQEAETALNPTSTTNIVVTLYQPPATQTPTPPPATATSAPTDTLAPRPSITPIPLIVVTPARADTLPAPVYFLGEHFGTTQIRRLERDGRTSSQITNEPADVRDFDVSPVDGSLAYVSGFDLFVANADGSEHRSILHNENAVESFGGDNRRAGARFYSPLWFPDGKRIALADYEGIVFVTLDGQVERFQTNQYPPPKKAIESYKIYSPQMFSPDGRYLLMQIDVWESDLLAIKDIHATESVSPTELADTAFCFPTWGLNENQIFCVYGTILQYQTGIISLSNASNGETTKIFEEAPNAKNLFEFSHPYLTPSGDLYFLRTVEFHGVDRPSRVGVWRINTSGTPALTKVFGEFDSVQSITTGLWDPLGRGLVMKTTLFSAEGSTRTDTLWFPIDGSAAVDLHIHDSRVIHWGKP